jgi:peptide/nickel transport system substrate-binding protein
MEKKNIAITVLIIALVASGVGNIVLAVMGTFEQPPQRSDAYILATSSGPATLEITDSWDSASNDVLEQVVETLFGYDLTNVDLPRVGILAESSWYENATILHIKLREGVKFHDGTVFDADAAKWNLDRLQYMTNATGTNTGEVAHTASLWQFPDGVTPIMNHIDSNGLYNITIYLNGPYAPFENTLAYINAGMLSPTAHAGDIHSFLGLDDVPVGTGPLKYISYTPDVEVVMKRNMDYWMTDENGFPVVANFETVIYAIYDDATTAHNAFLSYTIDGNGLASDQNIEQYKTDPHFNVYEFTDITGRPSLVYQYLGFNNHKINRTWREVFSYAFNYSYVIDELRLGNAIRAVSPISPGFGASWNSSLVPGPDPNINAVPDEGNVVYARQVVQSMGFGGSLDVNDDAAWIAQANSAPFFTADYHYNLGNTFREDLGVAVKHWLNLVGCDTTDNGVTWADFLNYLFDQFDVLGIFAIGWAPDYLDPYNMIDPLFNPVSSSNSAQVNDTHLLDLLGQALNETDTNARNTIYQEIQWYMATSGFFHAPLYHSKVVTVGLSNIYNIPYNAMGTLRIFPRYRGAWPAGV